MAMECWYKTTNTTKSQHSNWSPPGELSTGANWKPNRIRVLRRTWCQNTVDPSKEKYFPTWPNIPQNEQQSGLNKIPLSVKTNGFDLKAEQVGHGLSLGGQDTATGAWGVTEEVYTRYSSLAVDSICTAMKRDPFSIIHYIFMSHFCISQWHRRPHHYYIKLIVSATHNCTEQLINIYKYQTFSGEVIFNKDINWTPGAFVFTQFDGYNCFFFTQCCIRIRCILFNHESE